LESSQYADACNIFGGPDAARKLDVLRSHCEAVGRDYDEIEKTAMISIDPSSTRDGLLRTVSELGTAGFTVTYIFAKDITAPARIVDLLGSVVAKLA
jgi:hypothetical protein